MPSLMAKFARVTPECPCPVCGKADWCMISHDGKKAVCQRVESPVEIDEVGYVHYTNGLPPAKIPPRVTIPKLEPRVVAREAYHCFKRVDRKMLRELADNLGVHPRSLELMQVGWKPEAGAWTTPMRDGKNNIIGLQYRKGDKKWMLGGASIGLFIPTCLRNDKPDYIIIAEGVSDCYAFLSMGLYSLGRPACRAGRGLILDYLRGNKNVKSIIVATDNDMDGVKGAKKLIDSLKTDWRGKVLGIRPIRVKDARQTFIEGCRKIDVSNALRGRSNPHWKRFS